MCTLEFKICVHSVFGGCISLFPIFASNNTHSFPLFFLIPKCAHAHIDHRNRYNVCCEYRLEVRILYLCVRIKNSELQCRSNMSGLIGNLCHIFVPLLTHLIIQTFTVQYVSIWTFETLNYIYIHVLKIVQLFSFSKSSRFFSSIFSRAPVEWSNSKVLLYLYIITMNMFLSSFSNYVYLSLFVPYYYNVMLFIYCIRIYYLLYTNIYTNVVYT